MVAAYSFRESHTKHTNHKYADLPLKPNSYSRCSPLGLQTDTDESPSSQWPPSVGYVWRHPSTSIRLLTLI